MNASSEKAAASVDSAHHAGEKLHRIVEQMSLIRDMGIQVASAAEQQGNVSEEMSANLTRITQSYEKTVEAADAVASNSEQLHGLAKELNTKINRFRM